MAYQFFVIPLRGDSESTAALNTFLRTHRVLQVDRRWVDQGTQSFWAFCVDYLEGDASSPAASSNRQKVDYKEILNAEDFQVFVKLRDWRKQIAESEGVPVYTVFTNEQLAKMAQTRVTTKAALTQIAGVGTARIEKYGDAVIALLKPQRKDTAHETSKAPVRPTGET